MRDGTRVIHAGLPEPEHHGVGPPGRGREDERRAAAAANCGEQPAFPRNVAQVHRLPVRRGPIFGPPLNLDRAVVAGEWEKSRTSRWDDAACRLHSRAT